MVTIPTVLQALGLVGLSAAAYAAFGISAALGTGSVAMVVAGVALELERQRRP